MDSAKKYKTGFSRLYDAIVNLVVPDKYDKVNGVYLWGDNDDVPNRVIRTVASSGTAKSCVGRLHTFVVADGFQTKGIGSVRVNSDQTADQLLTQLAWDAVYFRAAAVRVLFNANGEPARIYRVPVKCLRKMSGDRFLYNPDMGDKANYRKSKDKTINAFSQSDTGPERLAYMEKQMKENKGKQFGQIIYAADIGIDNDSYPTPNYFAGLDDIESDAELMVTEKTNITEGFRGDVVIATVGELDDTEKDEDGNTAKSAFDANLRKFKGSRAKKILHLTADSKDALPQITPIDNRYALDSVDKARDRVPKAVCRHFGVPPVIVGFEQAEGLGNTQALINNMKLFNRGILGMQNLLSGLFKTFDPDKDWTITTLNLVDFIPDAILADLTPDERRALVGFGPISDGTQQERLLAERLGVVGTQAWLSTLADPNLTPDQKLYNMKLLFGLSEKDAYEIVYGKPYVQPNPPAA